MKRVIFGLWLAAMPLIGMASGGVHLDHVKVDVTDKAALQRGAKYFVNYCMGCHSAEYMRFSRFARDAGLTDQETLDNLVFASDKIGQPMIVTMKPTDSSLWFGNAPPDLSLVARNKVGGPDWLYSYLRSFYLDPSRPFGVNNTVFPDVAMPHVLQDLQGVQRAVYREDKDAAGNTTKVLERLELVTPGKLEPTEYDKLVKDLVTFLTYAGEPGQADRKHLGIWVLLFLGLFFVLSYLLKKEYWKDIH